MKIRQATNADISSLAVLATKTFVDAFGHTYTREELKEQIERTRSEKYFKEVLGRDIILVAEEDDIIGYVEFGEMGSVMLPIKGTSEKDKELSRLYVHKDHQREGIGKALLNAALAHPLLQTARRIYLDVWVENEGAQRLYRLYGFQECGKDADGDIIMVRNNQSH